MEAFGDRISYAVTLNEPNLHRLLDWIGLPDFVRDLERGDARRRRRAAGVEHYRVGNVVLPEDFDAMQAGPHRRPPRRQGGDQGTTATTCRSGGASR